MNKYEQLIEFIINDESDKARELFHNIVVEKSRDIYESLVEEEEDVEEGMEVGGNQVKGLVDEVSLDEEGLSEEEEDEGSDYEDAGDGADHSEFDLDGAGEEGQPEDSEERLERLEDVVAELEAEFAHLMAGEEHEEEQFPGIHGEEGEEGEEFGGEEETGEQQFYEAKEEDEEEDEEDDEEEDLEESLIREYVELAGVPYKGSLDGSEGATVGKGGDEPTLNTKDPVAGKNPLGAGSASAKNIATGKPNKSPDGNTPAKEGAANAYKKGEGNLPHSGQFKNVPGNKKVWDGGNDGGHGAEKKGPGEGKTVGTGKTDKPTINKKSELKPRA